MTSKPWYQVVLHVILPAGLSILLFAGSLFLFIIPKFNQTLYQDRQVLTRDLVDSVYNLMSSYYQRFRDGELSEEEAKQRIIERIRIMRYGPENKDYFWINDLEPKMIMHPYRSDLEGQNVADYADSNGKLLFKEFINAVTSPDKAGYVDYTWQWKDETDKIVPKVSYVRLFEPWGWIIGTGVYVEDVKSEINTITDQLRIHMAAILMVVALISVYLIWHGIKGELSRQDAETKVKESYERFRTVMDSLNAIVYVSDMDSGELLFLNEYGKNVFGDVVGKICWQVLQEGQHGFCEFCTNDKLIDQDRNPTGVYVWELLNTRTSHWYECHDRAIQWVDGRLVRLEIATDITARKEAEQQRNQLLKNLAVKNEELENIVSIASHDLRSPLINIQGFSGELENACKKLTGLIKQDGVSIDQAQIKVLDTDIAEALEFIKTNTHKMQFLVDGLLQLSRIGTAMLDIKLLDMNEMLKTVVTACQYQIKTLGAAVQINPDLPSIHGDYKQINQVFANLIDNALKYRHPDRPCQIHLSAQSRDGKVEFSIRDNGIGIDSSQQGKIFEMFHQLKSGKSAEGVGLGLTIVKRIVDIHGGTIRVESESGKGSTFYVSFPA